MLNEMSAPSVGKAPRHIPFRGSFVLGVLSTLGVLALVLLIQVWLAG